MKLRIRGNSLRFRLTRIEVADFVRLGRLENSIPLGPGPNQRLTYTLLSEPGLSSLTLRHEPAAIQIIVPQALAVEWAGSERVGLYGEPTWPNGETTRLIVEKDFQCLDKRHGEIIEDAYPHPAKPPSAPPGLKP
jgi:hypothetical protein